MSWFIVKKSVNPLPRGFTDDHAPIYYFMRLHIGMESLILELRTGHIKYIWSSKGRANTFSNKKATEIVEKLNDSRVRKISKDEFNKLMLVGEVMDL